LTMGIDAPPEPGEPANLAVALALAAKGFAVFPVHSGGPKAKAPMPFFRWREKSSTDAATIREWWRRWPDAAPALDVGKSGLFVVDADRHDPEHDGVEAWAEIMAEAGASPEGIPIVATPNEGNHWIFRQHGGLRNSKGRLPKGVDVRGDGGYIVAPGAVMADGRMYELAGDLDTAPPVPDWLTEWLEKEGDRPVFPIKMPRSRCHKGLLARPEFVQILHILPPTHRSTRSTTSSATSRPTSAITSGCRC